MWSPKTIIQIKDGQWLLEGNISIGICDGIGINETRVCASVDPIPLKVLTIDRVHRLLRETVPVKGYLIIPWHCCHCGLQWWFRKTIVIVIYVLHCRSVPKDVCHILTIYHGDRKFFLFPGL